MARQQAITIGRIDYANAWPIFHYAEERLPAERYTIIQRVPSALNEAFHRGEIDITSMSSFAYAQYSDDYLLLPDLSVSARARVNSILLITNRPMDQVLNGTIALTATSATSVNLLKIIMSLYFKGNPDYITMEPALDLMLEQADAALLIGDSAIKASWESAGMTVIDLGQLWREWTGHGMTFAVVAVRRSAAAKRPLEVAEVWRALVASKRKSLSNLNPLIEKGCKLIGGDESYWRRYFQELHYDFGPEEQEGLSLYFKYANQLGLLKHSVNMHFFEDQMTALQVNE
ncbi:menaquinone biosynthesis protein [Paenibacillus sp. GCM10027626]|uniref:menaquinone biosynthesis protein n=1 Tax=Paenibacillus sp. GCM10027626 TaxID=3273411 RepID=UPI0036256C54